MKIFNAVSWALFRIVTAVGLSVALTRLFECHWFNQLCVWIVCFSIVFVWVIGLELITPEDD